ncbi:hypothetical protein TanjilG_22647 [Lupinus angustifolius]|uniref:DNA N(6)-methyladenine demethylase n=1 Tax=Lupinus angustifolius TaxID=3871 RepID=A0A4P1RSS3_LUPAN|nr:PREDICTED: uncharacterized protein LOC109332847 [Lupinus angustifolius]XP_019423493.1 PREDICTED: uncharacterized protein LOC109332847 [Lupinus angustifolius]OIW17535.1 hypothetical protein TanjilG_22647 [Lupinus angustifolius]
MERGGGGRGRGGVRRSSPMTKKWSPRPQSSIQTPPTVTVVADQNSSSHDNNNSHNQNINNDNSPKPYGVNNFSSSSSSSLSDDVSNKLTISETETETKTETEPFVFDLCRPKSTPTVVLKPSLFTKNRENRRFQQRKDNVDTVNMVLRPGMVILKGYLSLADQVNIVKRCRELGLGCGGFCHPGYRDGAKLQLKMMCLGKSWDPQTGQYTDNRLSDGAKAPDLPTEFNHLVEKAIEDSHALIKQHSKAKNPQNILPSMSPNICIVNFYAHSGRLGLHRDKDESEESLLKGLPIVSFSIGDSADFLYGDESDVDKAQKVVLESGDVLIFGGKSRHVFHGVAAINPKTAPQRLLEETNLQPGRLNLTFRQY